MILTKGRSMRGKTRALQTTCLSLALAACATAPGPRGGGAPYSMHNLRVCPGMTVSNAPTTQASGVIAGYSPITLVRGVMLARAPVDACLSSAYGLRSGGAGSFHDGLDLYTGAPRRVLAGGDGRIASIAEKRGYGLIVEIDHGRGVTTRYAHLSALAPDISEGARVLAGDEIARTGKSGNATAVHLHYEILVDGHTQDPLRIGD